MRNKELIKSIENLVSTSIYMEDFISSPDALAVVFTRELLSELKIYHESFIGTKFNKGISDKLDNIEKFLEILKKAKTPQ